MNAVEQAQRQEVAARVANVKPLPGALSKGFPAPDIMVQCGDKQVTVRAVTATDMALFQHINSPFYQMQVEAAKRKKAPELADLVHVTLDYRGLIDSVFVMTRPPKVSRDLIRKGLQVFQDEADAKVGEKWGIENVMAIAGAIGQQVDTVFSTMVEFEAAQDPNKQEKVFFFQDSAAQPMASDGGQSTSPLLSSTREAIGTQPNGAPS